MSDDKKKPAAVWLCAFGLITLYFFALVLTKDSYPEWNERMPLRYFIFTVSYCCFGWLFGKLIGWVDGITRRIGTWRYETDPYEEQDEESGNWTWETLKKQEIDGRKRRLRKICCIALSLILCIALIFAVHFIKGDFSFAAWRMKEIIVGLWPFLLVVVFQLVWDIWDTWSDWYIFGLTEFLKTLVYYFLVGGMIWILEDFLVGYDSLKWEPVETVCLLLTAGMALLICRGRLRSRLNRFGIICAGLISNVMLLYFFFREHYRVCEILYNLGMEAAKNGFEFRTDNWVEYRVEALLGNLSRDLSFLGGRAMHNLSGSNPLSFINYVGGAVPVLLMLLWFGILIWAMFCFTRKWKGSYLPRIVMTCVLATFVLKIVVGVVMDALLVTSAGVSFPLIGSSADIMVLMAFPAICRLDAGHGRAVRHFGTGD